MIMMSIEEKINNMNALFPNLKFCADCDDYDKLDDVLIYSKDAVVFYKHKCYCCDPNRNLNEVIYIKRNTLITYRDFYETMNTEWCFNMCSHQFLEDKEIKNDTQINLFFGS